MLFVVREIVLKSCLTPCYQRVHLLDKVVLLTREIAKSWKVHWPEKSTSAAFSVKSAVWNKSTIQDGAEQRAVQSTQGCHWTTNHGFKSLRHLGSTFSYLILLPLGHQDWVNKSMESMQKVYLMLRQGPRFSSVFLLGTRTRNSRPWLTMTFFIKWIRSRSFLVE